MKKIFLLLSVLLAFVAHAQQWVSTSPQNKKALIEEFTGHKCQFCPDGHKKADDLVKNNPGKVYAVNFHAGGYATIDATYKNDMRTNEGEALANASQLQGYPSGTVNRNKTPWAEDRGSWSASVTPLIAQSSPANVAVRSDFNKKTGILKTEVEVYYTGLGTGTSNRLHLYLIQDSILGPQTGGTTWYPTNYKNGLYVHNKVVRKVITNINGDTFQTLKAGTYRKFTYETFIPSTIRNVAVDLNNIHVVAFISETLSKVITVDKTKVTYDNTPVGLAIDHSDAGTDFTMCIDKVNPKVTIQNNSTTNLSSYDLLVDINGIQTKKSITDAIAAGQSKTISLGDISFTPASSGNNSIVVYGIFNINNGNFFDNSTMMDNFDKSFITLKQNEITGDKAYTFEASSFFPTIDGSNSPRLFYLSKADLSASIPDVGAESTTDALFADIRSSTGGSNKDNNLLFGRANIPNNNNMKFSYYYAYSDGGLSGSAPKIILSYSEDCGKTWVDLDQTTCVQTNPSLTSGFTIYVPISSEYKLKEIDLSPLKGKSNIIFKMNLKSGADGGGLWVDQINVKLGQAPVAVKLMDDSTQKVVNSVTVAPSTFEEINALYKNCTSGDTLVWRITGVTLPAGWSFDQICDADCYTGAGVGFSKSFVYNSSSYNKLYPKISHNKKAGYGFITIRTFKKTDSANTVTNTKISLLTKSTASVTLVSDASDKLLYYFDNKLFVDRDFRNATIEVYDINGKVVMNSKVNSEHIDFNTTTGGIYIARVLVDGQVAKTHKFSTAK